MKKFWKATLIPGVICILAGLVLSAILTFGFHEELLEHADEFSINEDNFFEYFDNDRFASITRSGTRYDKSETKESYHFTAEQGENITGINFEIAVGEVDIRTGDTMEVVVTDMFENAISSYVEDGRIYSFEFVYTGQEVGTVTATLNEGKTIENGSWGRVYPMKFHSDFYVNI